MCKISEVNDELCFYSENEVPQTNRFIGLKTLLDKNYPSDTNECSGLSQIDLQHEKGEQV